MPPEAAVFLNDSATTIPAAFTRERSPLSPATDVHHSLGFTLG